MKAFLKHIGIIILSAFIITWIISYASLYVLRSSTFYKPSFVVNGINEDKLDYIVLGASTGLTTLNTVQIDSITGFSGVNLSMDDTGFASHYLMFKHFLSQGKTTKICIVAPALYSYNYTEKDISNNDYRFLMYANENYVSDYYDSFNGQKANILRFSKLCPNLGLAYYNAELFYPSLLAIVNKNKKNRFDIRGNYGYPNKEYIQSDKMEVSNFNISFENKWLGKIHDLCQENNIQLLCYVSPRLSRSATHESSKYKVINHSDLLKSSTYFYDDRHVNPQGRKMASSSFAYQLLNLNN